jgi:hypothetical protein
VHRKLPKQKLESRATVPTVGGDTAFKLSAMPTRAGTAFKRRSTRCFHCRSNGAELHGLCGNFTAASAERQCCTDDGRDENGALENLHCLLSLAMASATIWVPAQRSLFKVRERVSHCFEDD